MSLNKSIVILAPSLSSGGIERACANTAENLFKNNYKVTLILMFKRKHFFKVNRGIKIIEPRSFNTNKLFFLKTVFWLRKQVDIQKPNIVLSYNKFYSAILSLSLIFTSYKIFISERSSVNYDFGKIISLFNRFVFYVKPPFGVISQTSTAKKYQDKYYPKSRVKVIPNILKKIDCGIKNERKKIILGVGRLKDPLKGFDLLIESFSLIKNNDWELWLVGSKTDSFQLINLVNEKKINNRVKFIGEVKNIDYYYSICGIFVIPSRSEGFPNSLMEAMAFGCCCVSFDFISGARDLIIDGYSGIIVENGNVLKLAEKIDLLIEDENKRKSLGINAIEIRKTHSTKKIVKKLINFLNA